MDKYFRNQIRKRIEAYDIDGLQEIYSDLVNPENKYYLSLEDIYQKAFLCACKSNFFEAILWLFSIYENMNILRKVALRHMFFYGKTRIHKDNVVWYDENILKKLHWKT
jgi:hypothetical protein